MNDDFENFDQILLRLHQFLSGVPMHSLDLIKLNGGHPRMKIDEIYRIRSLNQMEGADFG